MELRKNEIVNVEAPNGEIVQGYSIDFVEDAYDQQFKIFDFETEKVLKVTQPWNCDIETIACDVNR